MSWPLWAVAPTVGIVYAALSFFIEDRFPFSSYSLYAGAGQRERAAIPFFRVDGRDARLIDYVGFRAIDPACVHWGERECAHQWMVEEAATWIRTHLSTTPSDHEHEVTWGFLWFELHNGTVHETVEVVVKGWAVPR